MAVTTIALSDNFDTWRVSFNEAVSVINSQIASTVLDGLLTVDKNTLVAAINEIFTTKANKTGETFTGDQTFSSNIIVNSKVMAGAGSAVVPSFTFTSDTDTGMYRFALNTLGLTAGGTTGIQISSTGVTILKNLTLGASVTDINLPNACEINLAGDFAIRDASNVAILTQSGLGPNMVGNDAVQQYALTYQKLNGRQAANQIGVSGSVALNYNNGDWFKVQPTGNISLSMTNFPASSLAAIIVECVNFGAYTITWPSGIKWSDGSPPSMTTSGTDIVGIFRDGSGTTYGTVISAAIA